MTEPGPSGPAAGSAAASHGSSSSAPDVSVVVVSYNTRDLVRECLETLYDRAGQLVLEVFVVDNASADDSADMIVREFPQVELIRSDVNLGFARANNLAFELCRGRHVLLLNPDAFPRDEALPRAVARMDADPSIGVSGGLLVDRHGSTEPAHRGFGLLRPLHRLRRQRAFVPGYKYDRGGGAASSQRAAVEVDWLRAAFMIVRRPVLEQLGGLDERFFMFFEELDLCRRVRAAGYAVCLWPDVAVDHRGGESTRAFQEEGGSSAGSLLALWRARAELLYCRKHYGGLGAVTIRFLEQGRHALRAVLSWRRDPLAAEEAGALMGQISRAWKETRGGRLSPPQPW